MRKSGGSRGGPSAQVEVSSPSTSNREGELTSRWGIRGRGMAAELHKVWLSAWWESSDIMSIGEASTFSAYLHAKTTTTILVKH